MPGGTYHAFSRGSNRHALFLDADDRADLLGLLQRVVFRYDLECYAYALMTNHCHYLFRIPDDPGAALSNALRDLNGTYSRRFNRRRGREAHAFRNRFGVILQESLEQFLGTSRYIVRNPVEAGLCAHPADWPWSSYRATAGLERPPAFLSADRLLGYFGQTRVEAMANYAAFVDSAPAGLAHDPLRSAR
jgi:REP-associated tyrosine transposase